MWRSLALFLSISLSFLPLTPLAQAQAVPLSATTGRVEMVGKLDWLKDEGGQLNISDVAVSSAFKPLAGELNLGFTPAAIWLRVVVARTHSAPNHWLLEITNPFHDDLRLYTQAANGSFTERRAGDHLPRGRWEMDYRHGVFRLDLDTEAPQTLWLRLQSQNLISAQVLLWQAEAFHDAVRTEGLFYGLFFGIYLTILIFHLFFWRWTRESASGWYALYVACNGLIALLWAGYFQQYSHWSGTLTDALMGSLLCNSIWIATMVAVSQMEFDRVLPRTRRALVISSALLSALFVTLTLTVGYSVGVLPARLVVLGWAPMLIALATRLWWRGHAPARFFVLAFGILIAGGVLRYLRLLGWMDSSFLTEYGYEVGSTLSMLIMSLAIAGRYNAMKREKLAVQLALNSSLEVQVQERTVLLVDEISRREALENDLRRALAVEQLAWQQQQDFVAMVSHEFRTPLAIINTSVHHVAQSLDASLGRSLERCTNIKEAARRMSDLMDEYLSLDRIEGATQALNLAPCDISEVVAGVVAEWPSHLIELTATVVPPTLPCDWKLLQVALRNLISNGLRHSPPDHPLRLLIHGQPGGDVSIEIKDAGCGIPNDEIGRIFEKYFRGRGAQAKPGAGLGLYMVQHIARLHGGSVSVHSEMGQGSTFVLTLPGQQILLRRSTDRVEQQANGG
jgi:signal transduction histidine kinase